MVEICNIKKAYKNQEVLKGINLSCNTGKIQALLGANGAGKTTLINIVSGLIKNDDGEIFIDGEKISFDSFKYRIKVGYVFEKPIYIEKLSANEYLTFVAKMYELPKDEYSFKINELLIFFDLPKDNKKYIERYSKGMKSKVSLAAALIHNPKYLILDEPFDGVDFVSIQNISKLFRQMAENGTTIFITSHQYDVIAEMCNMFAILKNGIILFNVDFKELQNMSDDFSLEKNQVKSYLEALMSENKKNNLSWIG